MTSRRLLPGIIAGFCFALAAISAPVAHAATPCPAALPPGTPPGTPPGSNGSPAPNQGIGYPPGQCQLQLSQSVVAAGGSFTASGSGYAANAPVAVALGNSTLTTATANSAGAFTATVGVPQSTPAGTYNVSASGADASGGTRVLAATITVTSPTGAAAAPGGGSNRAAPVGPLPKTGSNAVLPLLAVAVALIVLGTVAVLVVRRKDAPGTDYQGLA